MSLSQRQRPASTKSRQQHANRVSTKGHIGIHGRGSAASQNNNIAIGVDPMNAKLNKYDHREGVSSNHFHGGRGGKRSMSHRGFRSQPQSHIYPIVEVADTPLIDSNPDPMFTVEENEMTIYDESFVKDIPRSNSSSSRRRVAFAEPPSKKEEANLQLMHQNSSWYDAIVMSYCQTNRVMYIMRGVPGSGKSTIAKSIQQLYPKRTAVICSADDFRHTKDGKYVWTQQTLNQTHSKCEQKAQLVCSKGVHVCIIDNTNIKFGDVVPYLRLAHKFGYAVQFISTNSNEESHVLAERNVHNVPQDAIERMQSQMFDFLPYFYGWEISRKDTIMLKDTFRALFKQCISIPVFKVFATRHASRGRQFDPKLVFHLYSMKSATTCSTMSHVTACFTNKGKVKNSKNYINNELVKESMGSVHHLKIIGWCITMGSISARVQLTPEQKKLWGREDAFNGDTCDLSIEKSSWLRKRSSRSSDSSVENADLIQLENKLSDIDIEDKDWSSKIANFIQNTDESYVLPDFSVGSTAHITLGVADGGKPADAKKDLEGILKAELNQTVTREWKLPQHLLRCYNDVVWVVYLKVPLFVPAMYSATYYHK